MEERTKLCKVCKENQSISEGPKDEPERLAFAYRLKKIIAFHENVIFCVNRVNQAINVNFPDTFWHLCKIGDKDTDI